MLETLETMFSFFSLFATGLMVVGSGIWLITGVMMGARKVAGKQKVRMRYDSKHETEEKHTEKYGTKTGNCIAENGKLRGMKRETLEQETGN
jgi:hypothetical protein